MTAEVQVSDIFMKLSGDAAYLANNHDSLPQIGIMGDIFMASGSKSSLALDYNQKDIIYAWLGAKGKAQRQHKRRPYGPNRDIRDVETVLETLDEIAYDSIVQAVESNLANSQNTDWPLLALILDGMRNGQQSL